MIFQGLVGSDSWAIELTELELRDFCTLVLQLVETASQMQSVLADEENLECSASTENLTVEIAGYPPNFNLYLQLTTGRRAEGSWEVEAVPEFVAAIKDLTHRLFCTDSSSQS